MKKIKQKRLINELDDNFGILTPYETEARKKIAQDAMIEKKNQEMLNQAAQSNKAFFEKNNMDLRYKDDDLNSSIYDEEITKEAAINSVSFKKKRLENKVSENQVFRSYITDQAREYKNFQLREVIRDPGVIYSAWNSIKDSFDEVYNAIMNFSDLPVFKYFDTAPSNETETNFKNSMKNIKKIVDVVEEEKYLDSESPTNVVNTINDSINKLESKNNKKNTKTVKALNDIKNGPVYNSKYPPIDARDLAHMQQYVKNSDSTDEDVRKEFEQKFKDLNSESVNLFFHLTQKAAGKADDTEDADFTEDLRSDYSFAFAQWFNLLIKQSVELINKKSLANIKKISINTFLLNDEPKKFESKDKNSEAYYHLLNLKFNPDKNSSSDLNSVSNGIEKEGLKAIYKNILTKFQTGDQELNKIIQSLQGPSYNYTGEEIRKMTDDKEYILDSFLTHIKAQLGQSDDFSSNKILDPQNDKIIGIDYVSQNSDIQPILLDNVRMQASEKGLRFESALGNPLILNYDTLKNFQAYNQTSGIQTFNTLYILSNYGMKEFAAKNKNPSLANLKFLYQFNFDKSYTEPFVNPVYSKLKESAAGIMYERYIGFPIISEEMFKLQNNSESITIDKPSAKIKEETAPVILSYTEFQINLNATFKTCKKIKGAFSYKTNKYTYKEIGKLTFRDFIKLSIQK